MAAEDATPRQRAPPFTGRHADPVTAYRTDTTRAVLRRTGEASDATAALRHRLFSGDPGIAGRSLTRLLGPRASTHPTWPIRYVGRTELPPGVEG